MNTVTLQLLVGAITLGSLFVGFFALTGLVFLRPGRVQAVPRGQRYAYGETAHRPAPADATDGSPPPDYNRTPQPAAGALTMVTALADRTRPAHTHGPSKETACGEDLAPTPTGLPAAVPGPPTVQFPAELHYRIEGALERQPMGMERLYAQGEAWGWPLPCEIWWARPLPDAEQNADWQRRFQDMCRLVMACCDEPLLPYPIARARLDGGQALLLPYTPGASLSAFQEHDLPLDEAAVLQIVAKVGGQLARLQRMREPQKNHPIRFYHRALAPENVLLRHDGVLQLQGLDACFTDWSGRAVRTTRFELAPGNQWPPEIQRGGRANVKTDSFLLGLLAFRLLTTPAICQEGLRACKHSEPRAFHEAWSMVLSKMVFRKHIRSGTRNMLAAALQFSSKRRPGVHSLAAQACENGASEEMLQRLARRNCARMEPKVNAAHELAGESHSAWLIADPWRRSKKVSSDAQADHPLANQFRRSRVHVPRLVPAASRSC